MTSPKIIFEDEWILVVDKPSGLTVNKAETTKNQETVQEWVDKRQNKGSTLVSGEFFEKSGIVHRLDKDTSGLLIIAKTPESFENLKNQFKNREVTKKYLTLVHDRVEPDQGTVNAPISRSPYNRKHFGVFPGGREAETGFKLLRSLKSPKLLSFLEIEPKTGRTHQIRVHMKYINHPVVSDPIYGGRKNLQADLKFCPRLFLHAACLCLKHPQTGEVLEFKAGLPEELDAVLAKLC
ncbi:MAG: RluA family pseudouridine synthase [Patescibacteria group bacterium]